MKVLVLEDNLMWSVRLVRTLASLGHEAERAATMPAELSEYDAVIVNLGAQSYDPPEAVRQLKEAGVFVIGHAGHKEKDLQTLGRESGCDIMATNSQLTFKLDQLLPS
jgi:DNA-binding response OmpR family regulator